MFKRMAAGLCCLLLVFQLAAPVRAEAGYICFVAAGESILPLSDSTMPFWHNGYLYIASSIFTGVGREALNIGRISNSGQVILYSSGRSLWFEKEKGYAHDTDGNTYYPGGVQRNGEMYVPASVVAQFFGLQYSVTDVKISAAGSQVRGDLAWIRQSGSVLTEQMFVNAASFTIASRYMDYLKEQEDETTDLTPEVPTGVEVEGKRFYLCLAGGENTEALLDALELYRVQAAFFCTPEFMAEQGDLLRRMAATGQAIGILADAADREQTVAEQLEAGNQALLLATCGKTRLACVQNGDDQDRATARAAGYRCLEADFNQSGQGLSSTNAPALLQRLSSHRGDVTLWLGDHTSAAGLRAFLAAAEDADGQCLAWTETA